MVTTTIADEEQGNKPHAGYKCRYCKSPRVERIPRGVFVRKFISFLPIKRFICYKCLKKHYRIGNA